MALPFLTLAMQSPGRQMVFRRTVVLHIVALSAIAAAVMTATSVSAGQLGQLALILGVIEGAALVGWRLVQLPKSQSLEFLLVSPLQPWRVFLYEAMAGVGRFALVTLSGLPVLLVLTYTGRIELGDLLPLLSLPFLWGLITGFGLTAWAYERIGVRRAGEKMLVILLLIYLVVGVLAAERLGLWLQRLPVQFSHGLLVVILAFTQYNPFSAIEYWLSPGDAGLAAHRLQVVELYSSAAVGLFALRATFRLKGHFHDRHYKPMAEFRRADASGIGERPLSWWAIRRVMEYSGRLNIWIAGGFGSLYSLYTVAGSSWPVWLGRMVFEIFESCGGIPVFSTAMIVMSAVPAAFQYGLWDASASDRCKRLELLLMTHLNGADYWLAAAAAAWRRGRGYFFVAIVMWIAYGVAGHAAWLQIAAAFGAAVGLWTFSFALGFRAFSKGMHANGLGTVMTLAVPAITAAFVLLKVPMLAALLPPGAVYMALKQPVGWLWLIGPIVVGMATLMLARSATRHCVRDLRAWYERNQGRKALD